MPLPEYVPPVAGGFGRVIGIDRGGNQARLQAAGADLVVTDLAGIEVTAPVLDSTPWCSGADLEAGPWLLTYDGYDPDTEGIRETLCTLANGYWGTRGAAAQAYGVHYPGSYLAGVYNRLETRSTARFYTTSRWSTSRTGSW